jgi:hypothetical protein
MPARYPAEFQPFREANLRYIGHHVSDAGFARQGNRPAADAAGIEGAVADARRRQRHGRAQPRAGHPHFAAGRPALLVVIGPCSIHDEKGALDYAARLNALREEFAGRLEIVMRVYFEKPRTTIGWKGLDQRPAPGRFAGHRGGFENRAAAVAASPAWACRRRRNFWTPSCRNTSPI